MNPRRRQIVARVLVLTLIASTHAIAAREGRADAPAGQMTWALHFTLAPILFEPAETPGLITPFIILYALHDALVKPMPGKNMAPSLAESWSTSPDGLVYELVLEAVEGYWRKTPSVKRLVFKAVPDPTTRLAMLKRGEADVAYGLAGELGEEVRRPPGRTLRPTPFVSTHWLVFADQWDSSSPWHDRRVRLAATYAVDRQTINQAETLGFSRITGSIIPTGFDFYWQPPAYPYDPARAKQLLAEAGYPKGSDAGDFWCDAATSRSSEAVLNYLQSAGIRTRLRPLERAGFLKAYQEKKLRNIIYGLSGIFGNAATRIEAFTTSSGIYAYGGYPDIDGLFREQAGELDPKKREAILHRIQQLIHEKVMYLPIWQLAVLQGYGPRVAESGLGLITDYPWSAPYEDLRLKTK